MWRRRLLLIVSGAATACLVAAAAALFLLQSTTGLVTTIATAIADAKDGDVLAQRLVRSTVDDLTTSIGSVQRSVDAETRAATTFTEANGPARLTPLAWSGGGSVDDPVLVEVRVEVAVAGRPGALWAPGNSAGSASECYRFTVAVSRDATAERIDCPTGPPSAEPPVVAEQPKLPSDAEERVRSVLISGDTAIEASLRAMFPEPHVTIETTVTDAGETVAAVGVPSARECVVLVRRTEGAIDPVAFRPISLEPGEAGCSTSLYTNPPF